MPCICWGAVSGQEAFDEFLLSENGQETMRHLAAAKHLLLTHQLPQECYRSEFNDVFIKAFGHLLNGCDDPSR